MSRINEAADLLKKGNPPSKIAKLMGIAVSSTVDYLRRAAAVKLLFRYEILLSIDKNARETMERAISRGPYDSLDALADAVFEEAEKRNRQIEWGDLLAYHTFSDAALADMYELLRKVETKLHMSIRKALVEKYGEIQWWVDGIPKDVRKQCALAREEDPRPAKESHCYTTLTHLKEIYDKQWTTLKATLPTNFAGEKRKFLSSLMRLNRIRNIIMHPVRGERLDDDDFLFVRSFADSIDLGSEGKRVPS